MSNAATQSQLKVSKMSDVMEKLIVIHLVKTPVCCFITDCLAVSGYDHKYHQSKIEHLYFDGELPQRTFAMNWLRIKQYPTKVEKQVQKYTNRRYVLDDESMACEKLPLSIPYEDKEKYSENILDELYHYEHDPLPIEMEPVDVDIQTVLTLDNYEEPSLKFKAIHKTGWDDAVYHITSANLEHQLFDRLLFPEVCLSHVPCALTSKQVYDITRQHVLDNINPAVAKVTSNYDFCFEVKKLIPKVVPETVAYTNMFARTKKERQKIRTVVKEYNEYLIFSMTSAEQAYKGYPVIPGITANSEAELKDNVQEWLDSLMVVINAPLQECECCKGKGFVGGIERAKVLPEPPGGEGEE